MRLHATLHQATELHRGQGACLAGAGRVPAQLHQVPVSGPGRGAPAPFLRPSTMRGTLLLPWRSFPFRLVAPLLLWLLSLLRCHLQSQHTSSHTP